MSSGSRRSAPLLVLSLACLSCDAADEPSSTSTSTSTATSTTSASGAAQPAIELGTGLSAWQELADGGSLELVAGFQGGWHVDVSVRGEGLAPDDLWLNYEARDARSGAALSFVTQARLNEANVLRDDDGLWLRLGDRVVFDIEGPESLVGHEVCLAVTATSATWGGEDERCVVIVDEQP